MINENTAREYCREPIENIKNYAEAVADTTQTWQCHHINGRWWSTDELKFIGMYYHRPASELIFLTLKQHRNEKHAYDEERAEKHSIAMSGNGNPMFGVHRPTSDTTKEKLRVSMRGKHQGEDNPFHGKHHTAESRAKMSKSRTGKHWKLVDNKRVYY